MERWRERVETSQAHRQTLNPIAWAGSRKRIASDRGGGGGGGGKRLFSFFFLLPSSSFSPAWLTAEHASP